MASECGHLEVVRELLERGAAVNAALTSGGTSLTCASWKGHTGVIRLLCSHGAAVNISTTAVKHCRLPRARHAPHAGGAGATSPQCSPSWSTALTSWRWTLLASRRLPTPQTTLMCRPYFSSGAATAYACEAGRQSAVYTRIYPSRLMRDPPPRGRQALPWVNSVHAYAGTQTGM